ncbi:unnamed protein product [Ilex paraguariensis]|uniref:HSF-type DNA-binding domain-containing protein n=1 Tax=Ilex paraguariensis TaxID=185542 RepID=A0ABC8RGP1_9AQUA
MTNNEESIRAIEDYIGGGGCGDADEGGGGFKGEESVKTFKAVIVKEETVIILDEDDPIEGVGGGDTGGADDRSGGTGGGGSFSVPKPIEGLHEAGPPPFLKKTFEMVDNPETDSIISWSSSRTSFIVWNHHKFSTDLLPKHFKHNNFSSFIRQLNTYLMPSQSVCNLLYFAFENHCTWIWLTPEYLIGFFGVGLVKRFRKINSDRWEFSNEGFQKGKKHLLMNIKRRKLQSQNMQQQGATQSWQCDSTKFGVEEELQKLRNDQNTLKMEIQKLKHQQQNIDNCFATVKERLQNTECKQQKMVLFMAKAFRNPVFVQQLSHQFRQKIELGSGEIAKKRRLVGPQGNESSVKAMDTIAKNQVQEELKTFQSEIQTLYSSDESGSPVQDHNTKEFSGTNSPYSISENFVLWEKLMEDDLIIYENEAARELANHQSNFVCDLEDLIAHPPNWGVYVNLGEQVDCPESNP